MWQNGKGEVNKWMSLPAIKVMHGTMDQEESELLNSGAAFRYYRTAVLTNQGHGHMWLKYIIPIVLFYTQADYSAVLIYNESFINVNHI